MTSGDAPCLLYDGPDDRPMTHALGGLSLLTIGRDASCDISLAWDDCVSRTHAVLERLGPTWTIADEGLSRNGTYLNAERLTSRRRLHDGDTVSLGRTCLRFRASPETAAGATRTQAPLVTAPLTEMQRKVLLALCRPLLRAGAGRYAAPASNAVIAAELSLSVHAVKTHLRGLSDRLGVGELPQNQKRAQLAAIGLRTGLVTEKDL